MRDFSLMLMDDLLARLGAEAAQKWQEKLSAERAFLQSLAFTPDQQAIYDARVLGIQCRLNARLKVA